MHDGTAQLLEVLDRCPDAQLDGGTGLRDWSRRHLLAHLGFNAQALRRLVSWARTGTETPMYASAEQRNREIEDGSAWPPDRLRAFVRDTAAALAADLQALPAQCWDREVRTAQGRTVPAAVVPWMRVREVTVHLVDLDLGVGFDDLPPEVCAALVEDVAALRSTRGDGPALSLRAPDGATWEVAGQGPPVTVQGSPAQLARWMTGRGAGRLADSSGAPVPALRPWL